jgi:hypothetical protein
MSGEKVKRVSIEEQELQRLREQESRLRSVQQDLPERLNAVREEAQRYFQRRLAPLEQRTKQQEQETQKLKSNIKDLEKETNRRLQQQRQEFQTAVRQSEDRQQQAIQRESNRLKSAMEQGFEQQRQEYLRITQEQRQEYTQLIAQQDQKFTHLLEDERQARVQGQQILQQQINQIVSDIQNKEQLAQDLLTDVEGIWSGIERNYQHQRFAPGRLADLGRNLELARNNIQAGVSEAAIATSQQTYLDLVDLRIELEQKEQEWLLFYNANLLDLRSLIAEVQANQECEVEVGEGNDAEKFKLEVDYWVNGRLNQYQRQLQEIEVKLLAGESTLSTAQLQAIGQEITNLQPILGEIVEQAKLAILSSQLRVEIAVRVVETLTGLGYTLVNSDTDSVYEDNDQRNAYVVKVKNIAGDEVVTIISPDQEFGANSISINTFSPTLIDETATQQNAKAIFEVLETEGVQGRETTIQCNEQASSQAKKYVGEQRLNQFVQS